MDKFLILFIFIIIFFVILQKKNKQGFGSNHLIPDVIHKIFITNNMENIDIKKLDTDLFNALESWQQLNQGYKIKYWFGNDCIDYLKNNFSQQHVDCFNSLKPFAYKTDFFRYCVLYNEGGWYSDWQQKLLVPLDQINNKNYEWVSCLDTTGEENKNKKCMQNAFIGSQKGNIVLKKAIEKCITNISNKYYGNSPWDITGPCILGNAFRENKDLMKNYKVGFTFTDEKDGPSFNIDDKKVIINKCCVSKDVPGTSFNNGNNYIELWNNKEVYNKIENTKSNFGSNHLIPDVVHKIFINKSMQIDNDIINSNNALESWQQLNQGYKIKYWSGNDCIDYLKNNFSQQHVDCFNSLKPFAYKTDFFRYCVLYNEGGWYSDWQQKLLVPLDQINDKNYEWVSCLDICWDYCIKNKCMQNAFIGSQKGNIILKKVIEKCITNISNKYYGNTALDITGPYVLGNVFRENKDLMKNYKLGFYKYSEEYPAGYFKIDETIIISHKDNLNFHSKDGNNYTELWNNKEVYNKIENTKSSFGNNNSICILLTTCIYIKTSYYNKNNTPEARAEIYYDVIEKWLNNTNFDIKIVESSNYKFERYEKNPRVEIYSFKSESKYKCNNCEATPYEAESILLAFKNLNINKYNSLIKITGKYYLPGFEDLVKNIPEDANVYFQNVQHPEWKQQNSEFFGCKTNLVEEIMNLILRNSENKMNFESTLFTLNENNKYNIYRFPLIKLDIPVLRSGDNSYIYEV